MSTDNAATGGRSPSPASPTPRTDFQVALSKQIWMEEESLTSKQCMALAEALVGAGPLAGLLNELEALRQTAAGLREQLARQAPLCAAAARHADAVDAYQSQGIQIIEAVDRERDQSAARLQYEAYEFAVAVRALSVPAPPGPTVACIRCEADIPLDRMTERCPRGRGDDRYHEGVAPVEARQSGWSLHVDGCPSGARWLYGMTLMDAACTCRSVPAPPEAPEVTG